MVQDTMKKEIRTGARTAPARHAERGFTLAEVMCAVAILATGGLVMIDALPRVIAMAVNSTSRDTAYVYAATVGDWLAVQPFSSISTAAGGVSGDFTTLLPGSDMAGSYTWEYKAGNVIPNLLKQVNIEISWGTGSEVYSVLITNVRND
jgi:prepilin-type N-terminal cleavage/methylation domain-containing protein